MIIPMFRFFLFAFFLVSLQGCVTTSPPSEVLEKPKEHPRAEVQQVTAEEKEEKQKKQTALEKQMKAETYYYYLLAQLSDLQSPAGVRNFTQYLSLALKSGPATPLLYQELAGGYIALKQYDKAVDALQKALQLDPEYNDARLLLAQVYKERKTPEDMFRAIQLYKEAVHYDPDNSFLKLLLAFGYYQNNQPEEAIKVIEKALKNGMEPSAVIYFYLGDFYAELGETGKSEHYYKLSLNTKGDYIDSWKKLGALYLREKKYKEAERVYQRLSELEPDTLLYLQTLIDIQFEIGKEEKALSNLRFLTRQFPENREYRLRLGDELLRRKKYDEAEQVFENLAEEYPDEVMYQFSVALTKTRKQEYAEAIDLIERILEKSPKKTRIRLFLGTIYEERGMLDKAEDIYLQAEAIDPENADAYYTHAQLLKQQKKYKKAEKLFKKAISLNPRNFAYHFALGTAYDSLKKPQKMIDEMRIVLKLKPGLPSALNYIAYMHAVQGIKLDEAEQMINDALLQEPHNPYFLDTLAWIYYKKKEYGKALKALKKSLKESIEDPVVFEHLGDIHRALGNKALAIKAYKQAIEKEEKEKRERLFKKIDLLKR